MKKIILLLLLFTSSAYAQQYHVIIYVDGVASMDALTAAQKAQIVTKYPPPPKVVNSPAWQSATAAQKWTYWVNNVCPEPLKRRVIREGVFPILRDNLDQMEVVETYWKLAQEGTKYVFLLYVDVDAGQGAKLKNWLDRQAGLRYWYGRTMYLACRNLYQAGRDGDAIAVAVADRVIKYPVTVLDPQSGQNVTRFVPIREARDTYGVVIQPSVLLQYKDEVVPMKIFDGSR